jgi:hypothetical protein
LDAYAANSCCLGLSASKSTRSISSRVSTPPPILAMPRMYYAFRSVPKSGGALDILRPDIEDLGDRVHHGAHLNGPGGPCDFHHEVNAEGLTRSRLAFRLSDRGAAGLKFLQLGRVHGD